MCEINRLPVDFEFLIFAGLRPTPHPLLKKSGAKIQKSRVCAIFEFLSNFFQKVRGGSGAKPPKT